ncbi:MAG TPA: JAB domain-containing protein [Puia sp.]
MEIKNQETDWTKASEVELIYRSKVKASERPRIRQSKDAFALLIQHWDLNKIELLEEFKVIFLNQANKVLGIFNVSSGGITGTVADPRLIFSAALKASACNIMLAHSHPSGNLQPSRADEELTSKLKSAGQFLDIRVLDHLIVSRDHYYSFADEGLI